MTRAILSTKNAIILWMNAFLYHIFFYYGDFNDYKMYCNLCGYSFLGDIYMVSNILHPQKLP
jgi:hypothetical protein